MQDRYMQQALEFAAQKNPIWPFACLIVNREGKVICKAVDCAHISPLFHAEALAIHALVTHKKKQYIDELTLFTTAEPDVLSQSAIYWGNIVHDLAIKKVYFGSSLATIQALWPFGIAITAKEIMDRATGPKLEIIGSVHQKECDQLFTQAKQNQQRLNKPHPAQGILSNKIEDFYWLNLE